MGKRILVIFVYFLLLLSIFVFAQECVTPYENIVIENSTVFCTGTYYLNDTDTNGVVQITGSNLTLDCNYSSFIGNNTSESTGIKVDGSNIVIKNCEVSNYSFGVSIASLTDNVSIENSEISDCDELVHTENNNTFVRNSTLNSTVSKAIEFLNGKNLTIENSILNYYPPSSLGVHVFSEGSILRLVNTTIRSYGDINAINFLKDNITVICENSNLIGNDTSTAMAFRDRNGIIINGCNIRDWRFGIETGNNARVNNVGIRNVVEMGIMVRGSNLTVENIYCENIGGCINTADGGVENINITNLEINQTLGWAIFTGFKGMFNSTIRNVYAYAPTLNERLIGICNSSGIDIYNVTSYNFTYVIEVHEGSRDVYIDGVYAQGSYTYGTLIAIHNNSNNITLTNAIIEKANRGIEIYNSNNTRVEDVEVSDINDIGIYVEQSNYTTIADSFVENISSRGIYLRGCYNSLITNNTVTAGGETGIRLEEGVDNIVEYNNVSGFTYGTWTCCGPEQNLTFRFNDCWGNNWGLVIAENTTNYKVYNNTFRDNRWIGLIFRYDYGNHVVENNTFMGNYYGIYLMSSEVSNLTLIRFNEIDSSFCGFRINKVNNVIIKNNTLTGNNYSACVGGIAFLGSNVTSCYNSVNDLNPVMFICGEAWSPRCPESLHSVMRIDSDSCTPYLSATFDYSNVTFENYTLGTLREIGGIHSTVSTNMIGVNVTVYGEDLKSNGYTIPISKLNLTFNKENPDVRCYNATFGLVDCLSVPYFNPAKDYESPLTFSYIDWFKDLSNTIENIWELFVDWAVAGYYNTTVTITYSSL